MSLTVLVSFIHHSFSFYVTLNKHIIVIGREIRFIVNADKREREREKYRYERDILFRFRSLFDHSLQYEKAKGTHMYIDK
jgi:hypothetical protein